eukprot:CAMPEP_0174296710 /NCGR_PEP_ID=MMETSP0809-20121228/48721_1 /TAXON_ID=73025 ORGANISM="Eutreptiella gymnastica-like, Strain CCMP1594" /NCGR_SAMPLE_ID=MMETSP0809 /ASSEMBLY_ACC=CAM_ASM_000658 /LENGTH=342 /DNA_ID=CAMNT_0015399903 /DNA_START=126 /DNA_END=1154 /DNA_ORIENTATION=-
MACAIGAYGLHTVSSGSASPTTTWPTTSSVHLAAQLRAPPLSSRAVKSVHSRTGHRSRAEFSKPNMQQHVAWAPERRHESLGLVPGALDSQAPSGKQGSADQYAVLRYILTAVEVVVGFGAAAYLAAQLGIGRRIATAGVVGEKMPDGQGLADEERPGPAPEDETPLWKQHLPTKRDVAAAAMGLATATALASAPPPAEAESKRTVAEIAGSGLIFKDKLKVEAFGDPKIPGVTVYVSDFDRPINEKIQKDFFSDPSTAGLGCAAQGFPKPTAELPPVEEVFKESKNLVGKDLRVDRVYDKEAGNAVYVAYNTRIDKSQDSNKSRFKSAVCAVAVDAPALSE